MCQTQKQNCKCHCGTTVVIDQQLINQRQQWKQKYLCLQKQTSKDIGLLKEKIYQQCSLLMQNQFNRKEKQHSDLINKKNIEIQQLTSRIIKLQSNYKVSEKERQVLKQRLLEEQQRFNQKLQQIASLKQKHVKSVNQIQEQNLSETGLLKTKIYQENQQTQNKLYQENLMLKDKIKQFEKKYQTIIPEVQKLKNALNKKNQQVNTLIDKLQKLQNLREKQNSEWKIKLDNAESVHVPCYPKIFKLNQKITELQNDLIKARNIKKQVRIEPVYVDRPVEVERVVERIIQVDRIVKQYIQPQIPLSYKQLEQQNRRLREQLDNIIHQLQILQSRYIKITSQNEETIQQLQENISKYKIQRQSLVKKIQQQDEELQKIYNLMMTTQSSNRQSQNEKIVVFVNKDGTYNKRVQKIDISQKVNVQTHLNNVRSKQSSVLMAKNNPNIKDLHNKSTKNIVRKK